MICVWEKCLESTPCEIPNSSFPLCVHCLCVLCKPVPTPTIRVGITEEPQSVTALVGTVAQFRCAGTELFILWEVDGQIDDNRDDVKTDPTGTVTQSNLTLAATPENNGISIRCAIQNKSSVFVFSNYATLTVVPGMY